MDVKSIALASSGGDFFVMPLSGSDPSKPYIMKHLYGLDADDIVPRFLDRAKSYTGDVYDFSLKGREIVIRLEMNPNFEIGETYGSLRDRLYKFIASSRGGSIYLGFFETDDPFMSWSEIGALGVTMSKVEVPYSQEDPEIQITLKATYPFIYATGTVDADTSDPELIVIDDEVSTAPHGFEFGLEFTAHAGNTNFIISQSPDVGTFQIDLSDAMGDSVFGFRSGDQLHIVNHPTQKVVRFERHPDLFPIADRVVAGSDWPAIFPGHNEFVFDGGPTAAWNFLYFRYSHAWWGI